MAIQTDGLTATSDAAALTVFLPEPAVVPEIIQNH
jgi:hypothetical protein